MLSSNIDGCGSITQPGSYSLSQDINMGDYLNVNNPAASNEMLPCIAVRANNVSLNCNGHLIYNATYPISVFNSSGVTVSDCRIQNAKGYGIVMLSSFNSTISNVSVSGAKLGGLLLNGSYAE